MGSNGLPSSVSDLFVGDVVSVCDAEVISANVKKYLMKN